MDKAKILRWLKNKVSRKTRFSHYWVQKIQGICPSTNAAWKGIVSPLKYRLLPQGEGMNWNLLPLE
jgi:hypothetical protein